MEIEESKTSVIAQKSFSASIEMMSEYIIDITLIEFPWLNIPVVKQIFKFVIKRVLSRINQEGQLSISFSFTDAERADKRKKYEAAIEELKSVTESDASPEKKKEALQETKNKMRELIRFPVRK
jgi:hypothetical protein